MRLDHLLSMEKRQNGKRAAYFGNRETQGKRENEEKTLVVRF